MCGQSIDKGKLSTLGARIRESKSVTIRVKVLKKFHNCYVRIEERSEIKSIAPTKKWHGTNADVNLKKLKDVETYLQGKYNMTHSMALPSTLSSRLYPTPSSLSFWVN